MEIARRRPFGANPTVGERGAETQNKILAAGLEVFADVGFDAARVELITERAGCSRPAFYQYFSSKDDVFWKLAARLGQEMVGLAQRLPKVTRDARGLGALEKWIDDFATMHERYSAVFASFQAASREQPQTSRSSVSISEQTATALLRAFGLDASKRENLVLGEGVVAVVIRCSFYWENMQTVASRRSFVHAVALFVHRLFAGPIEGVNVDRRAKPVKVDVPAAPRVQRQREVRPRGEKTRRRLLDAGAKVLPSHGYQAARVDDIAEVAGVSHGSFYRYFQNKDDFFRVLAEDASSRMIDMLDRFPSPDDRAALRAWTEEWFSAYEGNGGVISVWQEMLVGETALAAFSLDVAVAVIGRLGRILQSRGFGDPSIDALAFLALTERMPYGVFTLRFSERDEAVDAMVTMMRKGFLGLQN
ncbi:MAG TPA: TetR/AcrR family transcriptional regulator [Acidimicrobiales bacterium]|nr:TetR/AcrR family transcriptional regulator [Acidimicrobiales bacterium]